MFGPKLISPIQALLLLLAPKSSMGLVAPQRAPSSSMESPRTQNGVARRDALFSMISASTLATFTYFVDPAIGAPDLKFETAKSSGLQWADAKIGTGQALSKGSAATVDYVLSTTGARYGSRIFATSDKDIPYRWTLGDGSTIAGLEQAILGSNEDGIPPMLPGGIRRVIIPQSLGYKQLAANSKELCVQDGRPGPIPPPNQAFEEYQRFKNIYCNAERQYQPDIVMDIKLYGSRSLR